MGVGKTFQALAFLAWIRANKAKASSPQKSIKGPILIVAPTALLANWKKEAEIHLQPDMGIPTYPRSHSNNIRAPIPGYPRGSDALP